MCNYRILHRNDLIGMAQILNPNLLIDKTFQSIFAPDNLITNIYSIFWLDPDKYKRIPEEERTIHSAVKTLLAQLGYNKDCIIIKY